MKMKKSNEGFSLVEMIVAVLVTSILMLAVGIFISTSNVIYKKVTVSSKLQEESTSARNFLSEILLESVGICESGPTSEVKFWIVRAMDNDTIVLPVAGEEDDEDDDETLKETHTKYENNNVKSGTIDYDYYIFMLTNPNSEPTSTLRYSKVSELDEGFFNNITTTPTSNVVDLALFGDMYEKYIKNEDSSKDCSSSKYNVIAQNILDFNINAANDGKIVNVGVKYKYITTEYTSNFSVNSRNKVATSWKK